MKFSLFRACLIYWTLLIIYLMFVIVHIFHISQVPDFNLSINENKNVKNLRDSIHTEEVSESIPKFDVQEHLDYKSKKLSLNKTHILISLEGGGYFPDYIGTSTCGGVTCEYRVNVGAKADATWYHLCSGPHYYYPNQPAVVASMESDMYYPCLRDPIHMKKFKYHMTYRMDSAIPMLYLRRDHVEEFHNPQVPFEEKKDALVFLQGNCGSTSGREQLVKDLMATNLTVHSYGPCLNNMPIFPRGQPKRNLYKNYKFCLTIENSITPYYITEKLYDGIQGGCVPIYKGAPNIKDYLPHPKAAVLVDDFKSIQELSDYLRKAMENKEIYESHLVWHNLSMNELSPGYQELIKMVYWEYHPRCILCQILATPDATSWKDVSTPYHIPSDPPLRLT